MVKLSNSKPRRPKFFDPVSFQNFEGGMDPAERIQLAHDSAAALIRRFSESSDSLVGDRIIDYVQINGVDDLVELWSSAPARTLPGALWRIAVIHRSIKSNPQFSAEAFRVGSENLQTIDEVLVGVESKVTPADIERIADQILSGAFTGDIADALLRAAGYCRVEAHGLSLLAADEKQSKELLERAAVLHDFSIELFACAKLAHTEMLS